MDKQLKLMIKNKTATILSNHIREMASKTDEMLQKWANAPSTRSTTSKKKNNKETTPSSTHSSTRSTTRNKDTCGRSTVAINEEYRHNGKPCRKGEERTKNFCLKKINSLNYMPLKTKPKNLFSLKQSIFY